MRRGLGQLIRMPSFGFFFVGAMFRANWQVAADILTPGSDLTPGVVSFPCRSRTGFEITLLSNLITLTPGTLSIDISADGSRTTLWVLGLYAPKDPEEFRRDLGGLEDRMLGMLRGSDPATMSCTRLDDEGTADEEGSR